MSLKAKLLNQGLPNPPYVRGLARGSDANISVPLGWVKIDIVYVSLLKTT